MPDPAPDPPLFPDGDWLFTPLAGMTYVEGKTHYPALLRLDLDRRGALELAESLIRFASSQEERNEFTFCGTIERLPPDNPEDV